MGFAISHKKKLGGFLSGLMLRIYLGKIMFSSLKSRMLLTG